MSEEIVEEVVDEVTDEVTEDTTEQTTEEVDWKQRALDAEALIVKNKQKAKLNKPKVTNSGESPNDIWEIAEMIQNGYTREDADFIAKNGGKEALTDPTSYVSVAMTAKREQRQAEQAADQTGRKSGMSEVERKYTPEQLNNMSVTDLEKILPHAEQR